MSTHCTILLQRGLFPLWITVHDRPSARSNGTNDLFSVQLWNNHYPDQSLLAILAQEIAESQMKARTFLTASRKSIEVWGHAVECAVAAHEGFDRSEYEMTEARYMQHGYGRSFSSMGVAEIVALLQAKRDKADEWVRRHTKLLAYFRDRLPESS